MAEGERARLLAWSDEMRRAHAALRAALRLAMEASDAAPDVTRDLLLFCRGFCLALDAHHSGEDRVLFPELSVRHPELAQIIGKLRQDHDMIGTLLQGFDHAVRAEHAPAVLRAHLEGFAAIVESHFRFEERELLDVLERLDLDAAPGAVFGPL